MPGQRAQWADRVTVIEPDAEVDEIIAGILRVMNAHRGYHSDSKAKLPSLDALGEVAPASGGDVRARSVLVVDDETDFAANVKEVLETYGYTVRVAPDGFRALEMARAELPDVVLLDVQLPRMNGLVTYRKLKEIAPDIRVMMMTGYSTGDLLEQAIREGARTSLKKPLDFEKLVSLLEQN